MLHYIMIQHDIAHDSDHDDDDEEEEEDYDDDDAGAADDTDDISYDMLCYATHNIIDFTTLYYTMLHYHIT